MNIPEHEVPQSAARVVMVSHWDWVLYNFRLPVARALRERGCEVTFVCPFGTYTDRLQESGFPCVSWRIHRRSLNPVLETTALADLVRIYRRIKPDVAHHFTIKPNLYGTIAGRWTRVPVIINTVTGLGYMFSSYEKAKWLRGLVIPLMRWGLHSPRCSTIFQTASDRQVMVEMGVLPQARTVIIPGSGVDIHRFTPNTKDSTDYQPHVPLVLLATRLLWDKGVEEFVEAARLLKDQGVACQFWLAGDPDPGNPMCIPARVLERWREEGNVKFLGHREDIPELLRQADIAVLPTSYQEGVPKFLVEATAAGLPVVATDIEGCRMVVRKDINGFLVPPKDLKALANAILRLLEDDSLRARFGKASREVAVKEFSEEKIVAQHLDLYQRLGVL